jgi:uncharacterized membrane protein YedE/YeeE
MKEKLLAYVIAGIVFGITITKAGVISWFRMQEMFRFQSIHMYAMIASAIATAAAITSLLRRLGIHTITGEAISIPPKVLGSGTRYWAGGLLFGIGWAFTGACPGPLVALIGAGISVMIVTAAAALVGTWVYGYFKPRLPH